MTEGGTIAKPAWLMMGLYARFGFEKILGIGHVLWVPLLAWVIVALPATAGAFKGYLVLWAITTATSLVLDAMDVWAYFSPGRRDALPSSPRRSDGRSNGPRR